MDVFVNGQQRRFVCFGFVDQSSTLITGTHISDGEDVESLSKAFHKGVCMEGRKPFGILIDNRFDSSEEHHALREFSTENGIEIVRTFPGNSKSNGNIEFCWKLFEDQIGALHVSGNTEREIARSMLEGIIKSFTMCNNHRQLSKGSSPREKADSSEQNPRARATVEQLARRLDPQPSAELPHREKFIQSMIEKYFGDIEEKLLEPFRGQCVKYPLLRLALAQASFEAKIAGNQETRFGPEYFLGILRNDRETITKAAFNESLRLSTELCQQAWKLDACSPEEAPNAIVSLVEEAQRAPSPAEKLACYEAVAWWLARRSGELDIPELWARVSRLAERTFKITSRTWQSAVKHIYERIASLLYRPPYATEERV